MIKKKDSSDNSGTKKTKGKVVKPKLGITTNDKTIRMNDFLMVLRSGIFFDPVKKRKDQPKYLENLGIKINGKNNIVYIVKASRLENTIIHQRLFESILELGEFTDENTLVIDNMYKLKQLAGINPTTNDQLIIRLLKEIMATVVDVNKYKNDSGDEDGWIEEKRVIFHLLDKAYIDSEYNQKTNQRKINTLVVKFDGEFINATKVFNTVKIHRNVLEYIHNNIDNPYTEKIIKYCITQNKPFKEEIWKLLNRIADYKKEESEVYRLKRFSVLTQRHKRRILASILQDNPKLNEFGINLKKTTDGQTMLSYNPEQSQYKNSVILCINEEKSI